jgi:hypothetical protein
MRVELSSLPAIDLGGECVIPQRRTWDVIATAEELEALKRGAKAVAEQPERFPLDAEAVRALAFAIETVWW